MFKNVKCDEKKNEIYEIEFELGSKLTSNCRWPNILTFFA